jgi:hypothetical protein
MATPRKDPKDYLKTGRPTIYTPELGDWICEIVASNPVGLYTIASLYNDFPVPSTIYTWHTKHPEFRDKYLKAKALQAILKVQEVDDMLDCPLLYIKDANGQERIDPPSASMRIARANSRKWEASRLAPKIYGERKEEADTQNVEGHKALEHEKKLEEEYKKKC